MEAVSVLAFPTAQRHHLEELQEREVKYPHPVSAAQHAFQFLPDSMRSDDMQMPLLDRQVGDHTSSQKSAFLGPVRALRISHIKLLLSLLANFFLPPIRGIPYFSDHGNQIQLHQLKRRSNL